MDFHLSEQEESLRKVVEGFVRDQLIPLEPEFDNAPDIFEGSRWKTRARLSRDPEVKRYVEIIEGLEKKAEAAGLWYLDVPKEYGGLEVSNVNASGPAPGAFSMRGFCYFASKRTRNAARTAGSRS